MTKICVCTITINDWYKEIVKYAIRNMEYYCISKSYVFICAAETSKYINYDKTRAPCWYKIQLISSLLKEQKYDYIVWLDADIMILRDDIRLECFINEFMCAENWAKNNPEIKPIEEYDLLLTVDSQVLNTGVMFVKNTKFNIDLFDKIWNTKCNDYFTDFHEQTVLADMYLDNPELKKSIYIIPYGQKDKLVIYWAQYHPRSSFLIHCARCSHDHLSFMYMLDLYNINKLDEENSAEYKQRLDWLYSDKCRIDIENWLINKNTIRNYSARCKKFFGV